MDRAAVKKLLQDLAQRRRDPSEPRKQPLDPGVLCFVVDVCSVTCCDLRWAELKDGESLWRLHVYKLLRQECPDPNAP